MRCATRLPSLSLLLPAVIARLKCWVLHIAACADIWTVDFETVRGLIDAKYTDRQICTSIMAVCGTNPKKMDSLNMDTVRSLRLQSTPATGSPHAHARPLSRPQHTLDTLVITLRACLIVSVCAIYLLCRCQVTNMTLSKKIDFLEKKFDKLLQALDKDDDA